MTSHRPRWGSGWPRWGAGINVNDQWIAATDVAHDLTVFTQDSDYAVLADLVVQT